MDNHESKLYLLVGGHYDGETRLLPSNIPTLEVVIPSNPVLVMALEETTPLSPRGGVIGKDIYFLTCFYGQFSFYRHASLEVDDVVARLLNYYHPNCDKSESTN